MTDERRRPAAPGGNVLFLTGGHDECDEAACTELLGADEPDAVDVLFVTFTRSARERLDAWRRHAEGPPANVGVVSVEAGGTNGGRRRARNEGGPTVRHVSDPGDLTGVGIAVSEFLAEWGDTGNRTAVCFDSVTALLQYVKANRAFQFFNELTSTFEGAHVDAHFHIRPDAHERQVMSVLASLFDDRVDAADLGSVPRGGASPGDVTGGTAPGDYGAGVPVDGIEALDDDCTEPLNDDTETLNDDTETPDEVADGNAADGEFVFPASGGAAGDVMDPLGAGNPDESATVDGPGASSAGGEPGSQERVEAVYADRAAGPGDALPRWRRLAATTAEGVLHRRTTATTVAVVVALVVMTFLGTAIPLPFGDASIEDMSGVQTGSPGSGPSAGAGPGAAAGETPSPSLTPTATATQAPDEHGTWSGGGSSSSTATPAGEGAPSGTATPTDTETPTGTETVTPTETPSGGDLGDIIGGGDEEEDEDTEDDGGLV